MRCGVIRSDATEEMSMMRVMMMTEEERNK